MEQKTAKVCLTINDRNPEHGVHALTSAAKVLSELQMGRKDRDLSFNWSLAHWNCGNTNGIVLCGQVAFRSQWQLQAYLDYIQARIYDMMDHRKVSFRLSAGSCKINGG